MQSGDSHQFPIRAQSHVIKYASLIILQDELPRLWIVKTDIEHYGLDGKKVRTGWNVECPIRWTVLSNHDMMLCITPLIFILWKESPIPIHISNSLNCSDIGSGS